MMAGHAQVDDICDRISLQKGWFWGRFAPSERQAYLQRRQFVEKQLYASYTQEYGRLKEKVPVYFYLYPKLTKHEVIELAQQRTRHEETEPHLLLVKLQDLEDTQNITFTLNDSFMAYWKTTMEAGLEIRGDRKVPAVLPEHNRVFPFSMLEQIHRKYKAQQIPYEIQIWDYPLLEKIPYTILHSAA